MGCQKEWDWILAGWAVRMKAPLGSILTPWASILLGVTGVFADGFDVDWVVGCSPTRTLVLRADSGVSGKPPRPAITNWLAAPGRPAMGQVGVICLEASARSMGSWFKPP